MKISIEKIFVCGLLVFSLGLNFFLTVELIRTREYADSLAGSARLTIGEHVPVLVGRDQFGEVATFDFSGRTLPSVLYLQSVSCHWCETNFSKFKELLDQSSGKFEVVSLYFEDVENVGKPHLDLPNVYHMYEPSTESKISFEMKSSPMTVLFSPEGRVQKIWKGAYNDERKIDIEKTLGINLSDQLGASD